MESSTLVNSKKTSVMAKVSLFGKMEENMKAVGCVVNNQEQHTIEIVKMAFVDRVFGLMVSVLIGWTEILRIQIIYLK
jgi:hypothetical protein